MKSPLWSSAASIAALLALSACSSAPPAPSVAVTTPPLPALAPIAPAAPAPVSLRPVRWRVEGGRFCLDARGYESLGLNLAELAAWAERARAVIEFYQAQAR